MAASALRRPFKAVGAPPTLEHALWAMVIPDALDWSRTELRNCRPSCYHPPRLPVPVSGRRDRQVNEVTTERISGFLAAIAARDQDPRAEGPDDRQVQDPPFLVRPGPD